MPRSRSRTRADPVRWALAVGLAVGLAALGYGLWRTNAARPTAAPVSTPGAAPVSTPGAATRPGEGADTRPTAAPDSTPGAATHAGEGADGRPPNVLVVTLCSVRVDHVGAYGYTPSPTPRLDALADQSIVFERAWTAATFTLPSHATLLTGLLPAHVGVLGAEDTLAATHPTLPDILRRYGYHTFAYAPVASRASFRAGEGLERGFDTFLEGHAGDPATALAALGEPYFAVAHFKDAHPPYTRVPGGPKPDPRLVTWAASRGPDGTRDADATFVAALDADAGLRANLAGRYDHALAATDAAVGALLDGLAARGLLDDTVVVVVGDHGTALGEEGHLGHQGLLQPEVLHVPLLVRLPGGEGAGRRVVDDVGIVDLAPTLLALAGATPPARLDGRSLLPLLRGEALPARGVLAQGRLAGQASTAAPHEVLVRGPDWVRHDGAGGYTLRREVGGVWRDVAEAPDPALVAEAARLSGDRTVGATRAPTEAEREALRADGYW